MSHMAKWWSRVAAAVTGAVLTLVVPVHAWAASRGLDGVAVEAVRFRRRTRGFGIAGALGSVCCLVVIGAIVLVVVLITRRSRRK